LVSEDCGVGIATGLIFAKNRTYLEVA